MASHERRREGAQMSSIGRSTCQGAMHWMLGLLVASALLLASAPATGAATFEKRPVLFVHGFESAGSNFASQAMRFESNGYPHGWVEELDYNSTAAVGNM